MSTSISKPRVLVTGAAGRVFNGVRQFLENDFDFRKTDIAAACAATPGSDMQPVDLLDFGQVRKAMEGVDMVLHLAIASRRAMQHMSEVEGNDHEMMVNVLGTQHVFEAARQAGVSRVVYMSSITVVIGEPRPERIGREAPTRCFHLYGATKLFGENLAEVYAREHGLSMICLRLGQPLPVPEMPWNEKISHRVVHGGLAAAFPDIAEAIRCALTAPAAWRFHVFNVISRNPKDHVDLSAGEEIGYRPRWRATPSGFETISEQVAS